MGGCRDACRRLDVVCPCADVAGSGKECSGCSRQDGPGSAGPRKERPAPQAPTKSMPAPPSSGGPQQEHAGSRAPPLRRPQRRACRLRRPPARPHRPPLRRPQKRACRLRRPPANPLEPANHPATSHQANKHSTPASLTPCAGPALFVSLPITGPSEALQSSARPWRLPSPYFPLGLHRRRTLCASAAWRKNGAVAEGAAELPKYSFPSD